MWVFEIVWVAPTEQFFWWSELFCDSLEKSARIPRAIWGAKPALFDSFWVYVNNWGDPVGPSRRKVSNGKALTDWPWLRMVLYYLVEETWSAVIRDGNPHQPMTVWNFLTYQKIICVPTPISQVFRNSLAGVELTNYQTQINVSVCFFSAPQTGQFTKMINHEPWWKHEFKSHLADIHQLFVLLKHPF